MAIEVLIPLSGRLDEASAPGVQELLLASLSDDTLRVTIDLQDVTFIDHDGADALVSIFRQLHKRGGQVNLAQPSDQVLEVLERAQLDKVFLVDGWTVGDRERAEAEGGPLPVPIGIARNIPSARRQAAPMARNSRLPFFYSGLVVSLGLLAASQFYFYRHFTDDDLAPYLKGNAATVRALLKDYYRMARRYPASGEELERVLRQKGLNLHNVYTKDTLRIASGRRGGGPGDLLYEPAGSGFRLRAVTRDGAPLRDKDGREFVLSDGRKA